MQHFVQQSIAQIEAIEQLEVNHNVSGLLWPAFITACKTEAINLRHRIMRYFGRREKLGIANVTAAKEVVLGVWSRRDSIGENRKSFLVRGDG